MNRIPANAPRTVNQTRNDVAAAAPRQEARRSSSPSFDSGASAFEAFNPMTAWMNMVSASMAMWSPLGYGAMQGPLGY